MDQILHKLTIDKPWEILLLPEAVYTRKIQAYIHSTGDGHRVFAMTPKLGSDPVPLLSNLNLAAIFLKILFSNTGGPPSWICFLEASTYDLLVRTYGQNREQHNMQSHFQTWILNKVCMDL